MKKILNRLLSLIILMLSFAACKKVEETPMDKPVANKTITIFASIPEAMDSKVSFSQNEGEVKTAWEEGDQIIIYSESNLMDKQTYTLLAEDAGKSANARFTGEALETETGKFTIFYAGNENGTQYTTTDAVNDVEYDEQSQNGDGDTNHLFFTAMLTGVDAADYKSFSFSEEWATDHGATFAVNSIYKLWIQVPVAIGSEKLTVVRLNALEDIFYNTNSSSEKVSEISVAFTGEGISPTDGKITAYVMASAQEVSVTAQQYAVTLVGTTHSWVKYFTPSAGTFGGGATHVIKLNKSNWHQFSGKGVSGSPFMIGTSDEFKMIRSLLTIGGDKRYFKLSSNIDFDGVTDYTAQEFFNGELDGDKDAGRAITNFNSDQPLFTSIGNDGTVKSIMMDHTSSITLSADITTDTNLGAIAGYSEGVIQDCVNYAPVNCSSTVRSDGVLRIGGIVGQQNATGTISGCENNATITCTAPGDKDIYMGGIAGTVERPNSGNSALIEDCTNKGNIKNGIDSGEPAQSCFLHMGGVVGWIYSTSNSPTMTITDLVNTGNVTKTNSAQANNIAVLIGGIVGGIHGENISTASGSVTINNSHVKNCRIQNGSYNNNEGYGTASHVGGFVGVARGSNDNQNITFSNNCYVKEVFVICRRGFAGGFASWSRGVYFSECKVLNSSVRGKLSKCWYAGGIAGCAYDCKLENCMAQLSKEDSLGDAYDTYTLYADGNGNGSSTSSVAGGIVAQARGETTIDGCKAFVKKMYQATANKEAFRGWIVGYAENDSNITIKDCAIGGACASAPEVTLSAENCTDYLYGSNGETATVDIQGTNSYWDASDAPAANTIVSITISEYATAHSWTNGGSESPQTIEQGDVILTASNAEGQSLNGNYNTQWRFYQARGGGLTVSVSGNHTLVKATFTYTVTNTGILMAPDGYTQIPSGLSYALSGSSALFTLGNTGSATNGQVRFTKIVIEYE